MIRLIVFFGNPGPQYMGNRHNAGWHLACALPFYNSLRWQKKFKGQYAALDSGQMLPAAEPVPEAGGETKNLPDKFHFLMPETFMNLSGESVFQAAAFYKISLEEILVVHDELEIPLGTISLKFAGGLGGHNGLRSMKACFGSADCWRLRLGIGRPDHSDISGWVLSDFTKAETETLMPALGAGAALLIRALIGKPERLLPEWAKKKVAAEGQAETDNGN
jgi:PTH1 family peptidyl-tRNA hydrolase